MRNGLAIDVWNYGKYINLVSDYGKLGDGTDNDCATAIKQAGDLLTSLGGGTLYIPRGTYYGGANGSTVNIANWSNIRIVGDGYGTTILKRIELVKNDSTIRRNVKIEGLEVDVDNIPDLNGIHIGNNAYDWILRDVKIKNTYNTFCLYWEQSHNFRAEDCIFEEAGLGVGKDNCAGTQLTTTDGVGVFRNCYFIKDSSAGGALLTTGGTGDVLFEGNKYNNYGNAYAAVSIENSFGSCKRVTIRGGHAYNCGMQIGNSTSNSIEAGIIDGVQMWGDNLATQNCLLKIRGANQAVVSNNNLKNSVYGVYVTDNKQLTVLGNNIHNTNYLNNASPTDKGGIYAADNLVGSICSNTVTDDAGYTYYGARVSGASSNYTVTGNTFPSTYASTYGFISVTTVNSLTYVGNTQKGKILGTVTHLTDANNTAL